MIPFPLFGEDALPNSAISKIVDGAANVPIELESAPTTTGGQLAEGISGYFGTNLYVTLGGTTYRIAMTAV